MMAFPGTPRLAIPARNTSILLVLLLPTLCNYTGLTRFKNIRRYGLGQSPNKLVWCRMRTRAPKKWEIFIIIMYLQALLTNPAACRKCQNSYVNSICLILFSALTSLASEVSSLHRTEMLQNGDKSMSDILIWD